MAVCGRLVNKWQRLVADDELQFGFVMIMYCLTITVVLCLRPAVPQLHSLYRCSLFEPSSTTVTRAVQMSPVWGQQYHSYTHCTDVPCLRPAVPVTLAVQMSPVWGQDCHSYTHCTDVRCFSPSVPQCHLLSRCALFEARNLLLSLRNAMFFISSLTTDLTIWFIQALLKFIDSN
jgi:hypothetical protein